jgi:hypothetical protein
MARLLLVSFAAFLAASAHAEQPLLWQHPSLELYADGMRDEADGVRMEFCVRPKEGSREGTVSVGYPRYRLRGGDGWIARSPGSTGTVPCTLRPTPVPPASRFWWRPDAATGRALAGARHARASRGPDRSKGRPAEREPEPEPALEPDVVLSPERTLEAHPFRSRATTSWASIFARRTWARARRVASWPGSSPAPGSSPRRTAPAASIWAIWSPEKPSNSSTAATPTAAPPRSASRSPSSTPVASPGPPDRS